MKCVRDDFTLTVMFPHHHRHVEHDDTKDSDLECFTCYHVVNFTEYLVLQYIKLNVVLKESRPSAERSLRSCKTYS